MKTINTFLKCLTGIILIIVLITSCKKDNQGTLKGTISFKFQTKETSHLKNTKAQPIAAAIILSIQKLSGEKIYDKEKLELSYLNGTYLSKGLPLLQGNYNLTEFLVTDTGDHVIYISPKSGSGLARLVNIPLPLSFTVDAGVENILIPEVLATDSCSLKDFGYEGFSFNPVETLTFLITVLSQDVNNKNFQSVDSTNASISSFVGILKGGVTSISLLPNGYSYTLNIWKKGYTSWAKEYRESDLKNYTTTPLQVILKKIDAPTITFLNYNGFPIYEGPTITFRSAHTFYADYGDGQSDTVTGISANFSREIVFLGSRRLLQIWGNVEDIQSVFMQNPPKSPGTWFDLVDLSNAKTLESITLIREHIGVLIVNKDSLTSPSSYENYIGEVIVKN